MIKKIILIIRKICLAFVMLYALNLILTSVDIFIPINLITLLLVTILGAPSIIGLVIIYLII